MARLWQSGFELNTTTDTVEWSNHGGTLSIESTIVRSGSYSLKVNPTSSNGYFYVGASATDNYVRAYIYISTTPSADTEIIRFDNMGSKWVLASLKLNTTRNLELWNVEDNAQIGSDSAQLSTGQWYRVEVRCNGTTPSSTYLEAKIDGATAFASGTVNLAYSPDTIFFGALTTTTTVYYLDDLAINSSSGSYQNGYPGSGRVIHLKPIADGETVDWTASSGSDYACVDEVTPNDATDYISSTTLNQESLFILENPPPAMASSATINVVAVGVRSTVDTTKGSPTFKVEIEKDANGTKSLGDGITPDSITWYTNKSSQTSNYFDYPLVTYQDPDSSNWTKSTLNTARVGVKVTTDNTENVRVSTLWVSVDYTGDATDNATKTKIDDASNFGALASVGRQVVRDSSGYLYAITYDPTNHDAECWTPVSGTTYTYYFNDSTPTDAQSVWTDDTYAFDGETSNRAIGANAAGNVTTEPATNLLVGDGTNAPSSGGSIAKVEIRGYGYTVTDGTPAWSSYYALNTPSGGWTWSIIQGLTVKLWTSWEMAGTNRRVRANVYNGATLLNTDGTPLLVANTSGTETSIFAVEIKVTVQSTDGTGTWVELDSGDSLNSGTNGGNPVCAIDSSGVIHVSFSYDTGEVSCAYATFDTSTLQWSSITSPAVGNSGAGSISIAIDSDNIPHIVSNVGNGSTTDYANFIGSSWSTVNVTTVGGPCDITIGPDDIPQIAVIDTTNADLELYKGDANDASSFTVYTVDSDVNVTDGQRGCSIAIDSDGRTWVAYIDATTNYVSLAYWTSSFSGWTSNWGIFNTGNVGYEPSIYANGTDVYIFYKDDNNDVVYEKITQSSIFYFDGSDAAATDPNGVWTDDSNAFDNNVSTYAYTSTGGSTSSNYLLAEGTNASGTGNIGSVVARFYTSNKSSNGITGYGAWQCLTIPTSGWTWSVLQSLEIKIWYGTLSNGISGDIYTNGLGTDLLQLWEYVSGSTIYAHKVELVAFILSGETLLETGTFQDVKTRWALATQYSSSGSLVSSLRTYYFDGSDEAASGTNWTDVTNADDGSTSTYAYVTVTGSISSNYLHIGGTNASTGRTETIVSVKARIYYKGGLGTNAVYYYTDSLSENIGIDAGLTTDGPGWSPWIILETPSGGWTWTKVAALELKSYIATGGMGEYRVYRAEIIVQTDPAGEVDYLFSDGTDVYWNTLDLIEGLQTEEKTQTADGIIALASYDLKSDYWTVVFAPAGTPSYVKTHTADGIIQATSVKTNTTDGIILETSVKTSTADGIISVTSVKTHTIDGVVLETLIQSHTVDALVQASGTKTITTDGIVLVTDVKTHTVDAIIQSIPVITHTVDGIILAISDKTHTVDGIVENYVRYWVGDSGNWNDTNEWSYSSGGTTGAPVPTASDAVIFDANSFSADGQTVTLNVSGKECKSINFSGIDQAVTFAQNYRLTVYGDVILNANLTVNQGNAIDIYPSGDNVLTTYGTYVETIQLYIATGTKVTLGSSYSGESLYTNKSGINGGSLDTAGYDLTFTGSSYFDASGLSGTGSSISFGDSVISFNGTYGYFNINPLLETFDAGTSKVIFNSSGYSDLNYITNHPLYDVEIRTNTNFEHNGTITHNLHIYADATFQVTAGYDLTLGDSATLTSTAYAGHPVTLKSNSAGSHFHIIKSTGSVIVDYFSIKDSVASGGAEFRAIHSTNVSGNSGWIFENEKTSTIDGFIAEVYVQSNTADGYVVENGYKTYTSDGIIFATETKTNTADAIIISYITHTADAIIWAEQSAITGYIYSVAAGDGQSYKDGASWATSHDASTASGVNNTGGFGPYIQAMDFGSTWRIARGHLTFDTSFIPSVGILSPTASDFQVRIYMNAGTSQDTDGYNKAWLVKSAQAAVDALATSDYGLIDTATRVSNDYKSFAGSTGFTTYSLNTTGRSQVKTSTFTAVGLIVGHDYIDHSIGTLLDNEVTWLAMNYGGTTYTPRMLYSYTLPDDYQVEQKQELSNIYTSFGRVAPNYNKLAQSFVPGGSYDLRMVSVFLRITGAPTDAVKMEIYADNGGKPTGSLLGTCSKNINGYSLNITASIRIDFEFAAGVTLTAGTKYWFVLTRTGSYSDTNYYGIDGYNTTDNYVPGVYYYHNGTDWYVSPSNADFKFYTYFIYSRERTKVKTHTVDALLSDGSRYWVGGSGLWRDTDHWAYSSGGAGGASVPATTDSVYVDANSGMSGGTITLDAIGNCYNFTSTVGSSWTLTKTNTDKYFRVYGSLSIGETMDASGCYVYFFGNEAGLTVDTGNNTFGQVSFTGVDTGGAAEWTLADNITTSGSFSNQTGTLNVGSYNLTATNFYLTSATASGFPAPTINMGSGTWTATGTGNVFSLTQYSGTITINGQTSTIKITDASATAKTFAGLSKTYNNLWITGSGTGTYTITGSNTFNDFKVDTPPHTVYFTQSTTTTVITFTVSGTSGNLITIDSVDGSTQHTLSCASGTIRCDYLNLSNSNAIGGASWYAGINSVNTENNSGWIWEYVKTFTVDGIITLAAGIKEQTADGIILETLIQSNTADGIVSVKGTQTMTVDGIILAVSTKTNTVDGIILETFVKTHTADGIILLISVKTHTVDALIKQIETKTHTIDAKVAEWFHPNELVIQTGSITSGELTDVYADNGVNLVLAETTEAPAFRYDFIFKNVQLHAYSVLFHGYYSGTLSHLVKLQQYNYNTTTWVNVQPGSTDFPDETTERYYRFNLYSSSNYIENGELKLRVNHAAAGDVSHQFIIDELRLEHLETQTHTVDGIVRATDIKTHTVDGVVQETLIKSFTADALISAAGEKTISVDGVVLDTSVKTNTVDGIVDNLKRYWVGGSGTWSDTAHWSYESNGAGGASKPDWLRDVYIDSNSGLSGGTITISAYSECKNITSTTGVSYTIAKSGGELGVYGSFTLESGVSISGNKITFYSDSAGETISVNGASIACQVYIDGSGTWTLGSDFIINTSNTFQIYKGTFSAGSYNVTAGLLYMGHDWEEYTVNVNMGSGTWTSTQGKWCCYEWVTLDSGTSLLSITGEGDVWFKNKTYYDFETVTGQTLWDGGTFRNFTIGSGGGTNEFEGNTTYIITGNFVVNNGTSLCNLKSYNTGTQFTLSKASGTLRYNYLNLTDSNVTGGASWYAGINSVNNGNNTGWIWEYVKTNTIDGILVSLSQKTHSIDGIIRETSVQTHTVDAIIELGIITSTKTHTVDGIIQETLIKSSTADALINAAGIKTNTVDGIILETSVKTHVVDGIITEINTKTHTVDGIVDTLKRYWVGGSANWDATAGTKWAYESGGSGGAPVPTQYTDVYFDAASGTVTVPIVSGVYCKDLICTGFTGTLGGSGYPQVYGNLLFSVTMSFTNTNDVVFCGLGTGYTITTAGKTLPYCDFDGGDSSTWYLQDTFNVTDTIAVQHGTLYTNGQTVNTLDFDATEYGHTHALYLGASVINVTGSFALDDEGGNFHLDAGTSHINLLNSASLYNGWETVLYEVHPTNGSYLREGLTAESLIIDAGSTIDFWGNYEYIVNNFTAVGTAVSPIVLQRNSGTSLQFTLSKPSGEVRCDYITVSNSIATGGALWYAGINSTDGGNNTGWIWERVKTNTIDGIISETLIASFTVDALITSPGIKTHTIDGIIFDTSVKTNTVDGIVDNNQRYWIGGTGNWNDTDNWSFESGGIGGAPVPDETDDVYINASSGFGSGGTITVNAEAYCNSFVSSTSHTYTITSSGSTSINVYDSLTLESGVTITGLYAIDFLSTSLDSTITTGGATLTDVNFYGTGKWTLQDNFVCQLSGAKFYQENGTFDANDHDVTADGFQFVSNTGLTPTVYMGSGTWTSGGDFSVFQYSGQLVTVYCETSEIVFTDWNNFNMAGKTFYDVTSQTDLSIYEDGTIHTLTINTGSDVYFDAPHTVTFTGDFNVSGVAGNTSNIYYNGSGNFTLSKASGEVRCNYIYVEHSIVTGGALWYAGINSTDGGNNTGWIWEHAKTNTADGIIIGQPEKTYTVDGIIFGTSEITHTADGYIKTVGEKTHTADGVIDTLKRYWVGNGGNWTDTAHWSYESGGATGAPAPTQYTDVYFDASSFDTGSQTVVINAESTGKSIDWTGVDSSPTLQLSASYDLNIYGSFILSSGMTVTSLSSYGRIEFQGSGSGTIDLAGDRSNILGVYTNSSSSGTWTLASEFRVKFMYEYGSATFTTNNYNITANYLIFYGYLNLGSSVITFFGDGSGYAELDTDVKGLNRGTSSIVFNSTCTDTYFYGYDKTFYDVTFQQTSGDIWFYDTNTFHNLTFNPGVSVTLDQVSVTTIENSISMSGTSGNSITLTSSNSAVNLENQYYDNAYQAIGTSTDDKLGQSFIVSSGPFIPNKVWVYLERFGSATDYSIRASVYTNNAGVPGTLVCSSSDMSASSITTKNNYSFTFSTTEKLSQNTTYWIVFEQIGGTPSDVNYVGWYVDVQETIDRYADGEAYYKPAAGSWTKVASGIYNYADYHFQFFGTGQHCFYKESGTVYCDYLNLTNSWALPGASWYAGINSVDTSNNDGWIFERVKTNTADGSVVSKYTTSNTVDGIVKTINVASNTIDGLVTAAGLIFNTADGYIFATETKTHTVDGRVENHKRYWVGNGGLWSDTSHWSYEPGGSPGAPVPYKYDAVYFDSNSFTLDSQTVTTNGGIEIASLDWTGVTHTPTFAGSNWVLIYGSCTFVSGMSVTLDNEIDLDGTGSCTFDSAGLSLTCDILINSNSGDATYTLLNSINTSTLFGVYDGAFVTGNYSITAGLMEVANCNLTFGSSQINLSESFLAGSNVILDAGTSKITLTYGLGEAWFDSSSTLTFYDLEVNLSGASYFTFWNDIFDLSFHTLKFATPGYTYNFYHGRTYTVENFIAVGTPGNLITISSDTGTSNFTISKASGTVNCNYLNLSYSTATGGASWYAGINSTNGGNNTGWIWEYVKTHTVDGIVVSQSISTHTVDGIIWATGTKTITADGYIKQVLVKTNTADGIIKIIVAKTHTVDGIIFATEVVQMTVDALMFAGGVKLTIVDAIILAHSYISITADGYIIWIGEKTHTADGIIVEQRTTSHTIDGYIIPGYARYSQGSYHSLPADDTDLSHVFTPQEYVDVETHNYIYVDQSATGDYIVFQFKMQNDNNGEIINFNWLGMSGRATFSSPVYLQVFNQVSLEWEELDSDNTTDANTEFTLSAVVTEIPENYYAAQNWVSFRVYQHAS